MKRIGTLGADRRLLLGKSHGELGYGGNAIWVEVKGKCRGAVGKLRCFEKSRECE